MSSQPGDCMWPFKLPLEFGGTMSHCLLWLLTASILPKHEHVTKNINISYCRCSMIHKPFLVKKTLQLPVCLLCCTKDAFQLWVNSWSTYYIQKNHTSMQKISVNTICLRMAYFARKIYISFYWILWPLIL